MDLNGKTILLSGASGGLGNAIADELAAGGAKLVLSSRREAQLNELAAALPGGGSGTHRVIVCDLAEPGAAEQLVADAGDIDGMVMNAALPASGRLDAFTQDELSRALRVNLESPIKMTRELLPALEKKGEGHLVFVASLAGHYAAARSSLYSATKFGLRGFALGTREDVIAKGIGVSIVSPGFVREAGMFADSGAKPPPGMGTTTPKKVAAAVSEAIRKNRSEIMVAPLRQRRLSIFGARHPELAGRITRGEMTDRIAESVAEGQTDKR